MVDKLVASLIEIRPSAPVVGVPMSDQPTTHAVSAASTIRGEPKRPRWIWVLIALLIAIAAAIPIVLLVVGPPDNSKAPPEVEGVMTPKPKPDLPPQPVDKGVVDVIKLDGPGRISVTDKVSADGTLTPDIVLAKIQSAYMAGIKRCYKELLLKTPAAKGKLALAFTVDTKGKTTAASSKGFSTELDDCVKPQMATWRFPIPKDSAGDPTDAPFAITLQLVPD